LNLYADITNFTNPPECGSQGSATVEGWCGIAPYTYQWQKYVSGVWTPVGTTSTITTNLTVNGTNYSALFSVRVTDTHDKVAYSKKRCAIVFCNYLVTKTAYMDSKMNRE